MVSYFAQLMKHSEKLVYERGEPPPIPPGVAVPEDDIEIVRAALSSKAPIVTTDTKLRNKVTSQSALGLEALTPEEAILRAQSR